MEVSAIGFTDDSALLCHTNQPPFSGGTNSGGDWFAPDGTRVFGTTVPGVTINRAPMVVRLKRRTTGTPLQGIYQCNILPHNMMDLVILNVGLYNNGRGIQLKLNNGAMLFFLTGDVTLSSGMAFTLVSDSQFTLTCISTGGPATTVTWTRNSITVTEGTETVLDNATTAQYTHTLTETGRVEGFYTCTVANIVSNDSSQLIVSGKQ